MNSFIFIIIIIISDDPIHEIKGGEYVKGPLQVSTLFINNHGHNDTTDVSLYRLG